LTAKYVMLILWSRTSGLRINISAPSRAVREQSSANDPHAQPVFQLSSTPIGLLLSTLSLSTPRSSTGMLF
jgi:hypothetical protein